MLAAFGGLAVAGERPEGPCVVVANHNSHADTPALLAALPTRKPVAVAAAADYWFSRPLRSLACRTLVGAFPVRRGGGGSADLAEAGAVLAAGGIVVVYPEGTRSRNGDLAEFRCGAAWLAAWAGVPLVPAAITGTRTVLPAGGAGRVRRERVHVRFGEPVPVSADPRGDSTAARASVADMLHRTHQELEAQS